MNYKKYYLTIFIFGILLAIIFAILGAVNILGTFPTIIGIIMCIAGSIGSILEWKERQKRNENYWINGLSYDENPPLEEAIKYFKEK